jgi:hypothetical protein
VAHVDPKLVMMERSFGTSSAGFATGSTRSKLHQQEQLNAQQLSENREIPARFEDHNSDDQSKKTTKSTADKLIEALVRVKMLEQQENQGNMTSPELKKRASAQDEQTGTEAVKVLCKVG